MKRSKINKVIKDMASLIMEHVFAIPPFASWTAGECEKAGHEYNGNQKMPEKYPKPYAEKLLMLYEGADSTNALSLE